MQGWRTIGLKEKRCMRGARRRTARKIYTLQIHYRYTACITEKCIARPGRVLIPRVGPAVARVAVGTVYGTRYTAVLSVLADRCVLYIARVTAVQLSAAQAPAQCPPPLTSCPVVNIAG